jgi:hypothetical protein
MATHGMGELRKIKWNRDKIITIPHNSIFNYLGVSLFNPNTHICDAMQHDFDATRYVPYL